MNKYRINQYVCEMCGLGIITVDLEEGVTPFALVCRATNDCEGKMYSRMYEKVKQSLIPEFGWYKPNLADVEDFQRPHIEAGGLLLRKFKLWNEIFDWRHDNPVMIEGWHWVDDPGIFGWWMNHHMRRIAEQQQGDIKNRVKFLYQGPGIVRGHMSANEELAFMNRKHPANPDLLLGKFSELIEGDESEIDGVGNMVYECVDSDQQPPNVSVGDKHDAN